MKRILFIAPSSYPVNGAEAIVNIKLLKALSDSKKFEIDLVSKKRKWVNYPSGNIGDYGVKLNHIEIIEVDNKINIKTLIQTLFSILKFKVFYIGCHWAYAAFKPVEKLIKTNSYDYVLTKDTPSFILGSYIKKKYGLKWVATWNDPFPAKKYPMPYGKGKDAKLSKAEEKVLQIMEEADIHIFPNSRLRDYMLSYLKIPLQKTCVIPHVILDTKKHTRKYDGILRLTHIGNVSSPRDPRPLLDGIKKAISINPNLRIKLDFIGNIDSKLNDYISSNGLEEYVGILGTVEYNKSLELLNNYDVAVLIEANCEEGIFLPTKVSDFMQNSIPILAVSPNTGVLKDLYNEGNIAYFARVDRPVDISTSILSIYTDWKEGRLAENAYLKTEFTQEGVVKKYISF